MRRILFSFLAGSLITCAAVVAADYAMGVMFVAGILMVIVAQVAYVSKTANARAVARFLLAVAESLESARESAPRARATAKTPDSQEAADLESALRNFGMPGKKAASVAQQVAKDGGTLEDMIRRATARVN